jgi:predicted AAA+ superfamily ATPase
MVKIYPLKLSMKSPKIFLNDTGLLCHLRGESVDSLMANRTTVGAFLENFIVMEIIKSVRRSASKQVDQFSKDFSNHSKYNLLPVKHLQALSQTLLINRQTMICS